ncbi:MAG: DUF2135 domain-containing protein [Bacteroidales bacterium]|nr:DUF2135 domain-containing protein [Bacteroidales bacterium]
MKTLKIHNRKIFLLILITILFNPFLSFVNAQSNNQGTINPVMKISNLNRNTENPMRLDILNIDIKVVGQIAVTTLDMTYFNNNSRVMEGEFNFPLGEGQAVSRFALDINGALRAGVVVEKKQGRKTFEAIVRRGVDPGLLEMTEGNNFRSRVYPLPAKGSRRIVLSFEQELTDKGNNDLYILPLKINESVRKFSIHAEVIKNQVVLDLENNELSNLSFSHWNDSYVADFKQDNYTPDKQIALAFPHVSDSARIFTAAKNNNSDSSYFYLSIRPRIIVKAKMLPKQITLLWDNSNSAQDRNIEKELAVLGAYIQKIGSLSIELVPFNIKTGKAETFEIANGNWDKLKSTIKAMVLDGGTSFGSIDFTKFKSEEVLLFTDGMTNFGSPEPVFSKTPVNTINSSVTANHAFLTYIAQRSGGVYINLNKLTSAEASTLLNNSNFHFISALVENGKVSDIYPSMPYQFNNSFSLTGIMAGKSATLLLNFGFGTTFVYSKRIMINADNSVEPALLRRLWAEKKIAELNLEAEKNKDEISLTGKEFGTVTQNTSLIVLENLSDYLLYDIVPPKELQKEYFKQKYTNEKDASERIKNHIDYVVTLLNEQSKWWITNYPVLPDKPVNAQRSGNNQAQLPDSVVTDANLEEVVVVGYGAQIRGNVAGVVSSNRRNRPLAGREAMAIIMVEEPAEPNQAPIPFLYVGQSNDMQKAGNKADIQLNAWDPQTPYLKVLQYAPKGEEYSTYLKLKKEYGSTPSFYIDASDFFSKTGKKDNAVRILSNLAELMLESPELLRTLGKKLLALNCNAEAVMVFKKVLELKEEEPQSYCDLGLAYEANGNSQQAISTLYEVVKKEWDSRFPAIEIIVLNEINNLIAIHPKLEYSFVDKRLLKNEPVDIRVVLTWETDNCDIDLWVTDPSGEKCFYGNRLTRVGGKISNDFTGGYGPEEFMIKKAIQGEYRVQANYYGTRSQSQLAPVNLHLKFITNFGKSDQKKQEITIRLEDQKDIIDVGKFSFSVN